MPDNEENKTVDIDTSGPDTEVELESTPEENTTEQETAGSTETSSTETVEAAPEEKKQDQEQKESKDKELETYSKDVQRRIAKLTHKWREAERQKEEALTYAESQIKAKKEAEAKISKYEPEFFKNAEDSVTNGLVAAQAKLAAAREANDLQAEADALTAISELGYKKAKLEETKAAQEEFNSSKSKEIKPEAGFRTKANLNQAPAPDPKAEDWASKNSWFGKDTAMTYTAFDLHKKLTEEEGYDPQSDEYYSEIDKRIRLEFPHKFGTNDAKGETTKPVQTVASAKRSTNTGRKTVRLTSSQVAIAKKLGVPLEEYAKQLKITKEV